MLDESNRNKTFNNFKGSKVIELVKEIIGKDIQKRPDQVPDGHATTNQYQFISRKEGRL